MECKVIVKYYHQSIDSFMFPETVSFSLSYFDSKTKAFFRLHHLHFCILVDVNKLFPSCMWECTFFLLCKKVNHIFLSYSMVCIYLWMIQNG